jgi:hypothetical protein
LLLEKQHMANALGNYNPIFYANEALIHLRNALGMAARVHRGYEAERRSVNVGQTISIRKPSTFTAEDPIANTQDVATQVVDITLDKNPGVRFALTDLELAYTGEQVVTEHIMPAAYAIANKIDQYLVALYKDVPWMYDYGSATDHTIITGAKKEMFDRAVPVDDEGRMHMMVDGNLQMYFENSTTFHSASVTGPGGNQTLMRGGLGTRFGIECFANQNVTAAATHTVGTIISGSDQAGALTANLAKGATTMALGSMAATETLKAGDTFSIAGNTQRYAVTADITMSGGAGNVTFTPPAAQAYSSGAVVTFYVQTSGVQQLMFHRNAFALAMAPLPDRLPGIEVAVASDPVTGLSLRARRWSVGLTATTYIALDALLGVKTLDSSLAQRVWT